MKLISAIYDVVLKCHVALYLRALTIGFSCCKKDKRDLRNLVSSLQSSLFSFCAKSAPSGLIQTFP